MEEKEKEKEKKKKGKEKEETKKIPRRNANYWNVYPSV